MMTFRIIRKIGKMLRGGAGSKEIFLGALMGVLIGFNPVAGLTLFLAILLTLLLNANIGFTLLGFALGKVLSLVLAAVSFNTGYFIIHKIGLEGLFTALVNAPVTALMDLDVYAMVGGLPFALIIGVAFGQFMSLTVKKIREQMVKAGEHEKVGKAVHNTFSKFLMWLAFGKQKISTADVLEKQAPLLRKSGIIFVAVVLVFGLLLEFFLLDVLVRKGLETGLAAETGAEVNVADVHLSLAGGKLEISGLQVTDPDKPTHNLIQLETLAADLSVGDLLRQTYAIDLLAGSTLKRNVLRNSPGAVYEKPKEDDMPEQQPGKQSEEQAEPGQSLEAYFAQANAWKKYGDKAYEFLKKSKDNAESVAKQETPKAPREKAKDHAKKYGYLKAAADLVSTRPKWLIREIRIDDVQLGGGFPPQTIEGTEVCSHPELNGKPTSLTLTPVGGTEPTAKMVLRFDDPAAMHQLNAKISKVDIGGTIETSADFPLNLNEGKADINVNGTFSADSLALPFTLAVYNLKANVKEGQSVMGLDPATASEILSSVEQLDIEGALGGSLLSPRVKIDYDKLTANLRSAATAAGKKMLKDRAGKELDKALKGKDADELKSKARNALKGLF